MKLTAIRPHPHRPDVFKVMIDNRLVGLLTGEDIARLSLVSGQTIGADIYQHVIERCAYNDFYYRAIRYVDLRLRSISEVRHYLISKHCPATYADDIISKLLNKGLIDENKLVTAFVHDASIGKPTSKRALLLKLRQKNIGQETINSALSGIQIDDEVNLDRLIARKSRQSSYANNQPRLFRFLLRQGFSYEDIAKRIGKPKMSSGRGRSGNRTLFQ